MLQLKANSVTVVARKDIMLHPASTRTVYAINVGRLAIYRRSAVANVPGPHKAPDQLTIFKMMKQININYSILLPLEKSHPGMSVLTYIEGVIMSMQLDTGASLSLMAETTFREH